MTALRAILRGAAMGLAWFAAAVLFVLSPAIGSIASILAVLALLLLSPMAFLRGSWTTLRAQPAMLLFLAAFVSLLVCFIATAREFGDTLFSTNFLALLLAPVAYLLALRRPGARTIAIIATLCAVGAVVGALTGSYDVFIQHKERAVGWGSGGNLMARTVVLLGFVGLAGTIALRSPWRWLLVLGAAASLFALYLTSTRGVFVAVPVLGLLFVWALLREMRAGRLWYLAGLAVLVVAVGAVAVMSPRFLAVASLLEQVVLDPSAIPDPSTTERLAMWQAGWSALLRAPLIGHGWAHLSEAALPYVLSMYHNDFFNAAVAAGVVGIVAWLATLLAPVVGVLAMPADRYSNLRLYGALLLSVGFFIFGLTDMTFGYDLPTTLHAVLTAILLGAFREPDEVSRP
ncbi:MAG: O-antigen ligase family protein [Devosia sp.]